jgi:hypothetical protein
MTPEDEAFNELEKSLQRKVSHGVTDGSLWRKRNISREEMLAMARYAGLTIGKDTDVTLEELEAYTKLVQQTLEGEKHLTNI